MKSKLIQLFKEYHISNIDSNSKRIKQGGAFFAIKGTSFDGNQYIDDAIKAGASLIFSDNKLFESSEIPLVYVENVRDSFAIACEILYPLVPENRIAVTGTNGKTSVVSYCQQLFALLGTISASIGTIGVQCSEEAITKKFDNDDYKLLTTADILTFRRILNILAEDHVKNLSFEASSHGIEQQRLGELKVQAAGFTSFSQDHLDYHGTMEKYLDVKLELFSKYLQVGGLAVINSEIQEINYIRDFLSSKNIRFLTVGGVGDVKVHVTNNSIEGQEIVFEYNENKYKFKTEIIGSFQASNLLIAIMLVKEFGFSIESIISKVCEVKAVKGRLERVTKLSDPYQVFVDYSHTPDSLKKALEELAKIKPTTDSKLIVIFGCGGNRDITKRPLMGKVASIYADETIITDDNPRFEDASHIRKQILDGNIFAKEISDRRGAIIFGINRLKAGDILLIAGKGHENYQIIGEAKIAFDDFEIANAVLRGKE